MGHATQHSVGACEGTQAAGGLAKIEEIHFHSQAGRCPPQWSPNACGREQQCGPFGFGIISGPLCIAPSLVWSSFHLFAKKYGHLPPPNPYKPETAFLTYFKKSTHTPPPKGLHYPARKKSRKQGYEAALREYFEDIIGWYAQENWEIIYPDGSSELHPIVGRVGGCGVFFGDSRDVVEPLPTDEEQTNNRGELRATLAALQGHRPGSRSLICPDSMYVVDGVLGRAQKWRRHNWQTASGPTWHMDLWTQVLDILEKVGSEIQWLHVPSHIPPPPCLSYGRV